MKSMVIEKVKAEKLNPAEYNPRKNLKPTDPEYIKLKRSLEEFGYVEPIIWNERTGHVVGGHQRLKILQELGEREIEVVKVDLDEQQEKALNVALNRIEGDWDYKILNQVIQDIGFLEAQLTGFDPDEIALLMAKGANQQFPENARDGESESEIDGYDGDTVSWVVKIIFESEEAGNAWLGDHDLPDKFTGRGRTTFIDSSEVLDDEDQY